MHEIGRSAIKKDLWGFGLPAILVLFLGLIVSSRDGYDGLTGALWDLIRQPENLSRTPVNEIIGLALFVAGMSIAFVAVGTLKRFYSSTLVTRTDHQLITHGIYRLTRHPIYLGVLLVLVGGVPVYASSLYGLLTMSVLIPLFLNRIRMEERLLTEEFGEDYQSYKRATRKLIPFIY